VWGQANFLAFWEVATFVCCLYVAFSVPYNVTFAERQEQIILQAGGEVHNDCVFLHLLNFPPQKFYLSLMDLVVDAVFYIDIVLNFHRCVLAARLCSALLCFALLCSHHSYSPRCSISTALYGRFRQTFPRKPGTQARRTGC